MNTWDLVTIKTQGTRDRVRMYLRHPDTDETVAFDVPAAVAERKAGLVRGVLDAVYEQGRRDGATEAQRQEGIFTAD